MSTLKLKEELEAKQREFNFKDDIFATTLLTNPGYISSSRTIMFNSHLRQFVNLINPDFPYVFTNYENVVGKHSTGFYQAKNELEVIDKIPKFKNGVLDDHIYLLFVYDKKRDRYDVIEKKIVEDLTEKFGFLYDNTVMDQKFVGETIEEGEVLFKTASYDKDMNYCYGKNAKFVYMLENHTIEDAILVRRGYANQMISKEIETVKVSLNDNDFFCNFYGNNEVYKCFPDINEYVKDKIVCAKRRIHNNQLLYDLKKSNLRKINFSSDNLSFCEGRVVDLTIYCNKPIESIEDNSFNSQLLSYLKMQKEFYQRVYDRCKTIIKSGSEFSSDINYYFKKARDILDENYKWREDDNSVFSNMVIEFVIERSIPLTRGQKITGRYGNKGVISKIVEDDEMPFLEDGTPIDIIFNTLGVINRLNSQQLFEQSITFICNRVRERMRTMDSLKEKEDLLLRILWYFNEEQSVKVGKYLGRVSEKKKKKFFDDVEKIGIYVHIPPLWEKESLFDRLWKLYDEFPWIQPYDVYVNRFGRKIKIMKKLVVGDMYVIKLKQTSKKGFSVRSTGSLSKKGVPEKSNKAKTHQEMYSKTPIRIGDQENINSAIGVDTREIAKLHLFYRSSILGRRHLGEQLIESLKPLKDFEYGPEFSNRNVEILEAYLKAMGLRLQFSDDSYNVEIYLDEIQDFHYEGQMYICTKAEFEDIKIEVDIRKKYAEQYCFVGTNEEFEELIKKEVAIQKYRNEGGIYIDIAM